MRRVVIFAPLVLVAILAYSAHLFLKARDEALARDQAKTVEATSRFTLDLYKALREREGNVFASPLNIAAALEMAGAGAVGETALQIKRTLGLDALGDRAPGAVGSLLASLHSDAGPIDAKEDRQPPRLWTANALWLDEGKKPLPQFAATLDRAFQTQPHAADFAHSPAAARQTINRWVESQTNNRITNLLSADAVRPDTAVVLTSAIYFKAFWADPFQSGNTRPEDFHPTGGAAVTVDMMHQEEWRDYFENDSFQAVSLRYRRSKLAMLALLPKSPDGLPDLEASLSLETLNEATSNMRHRLVILSLPRFSSTVEFELKDVLSAIGMPAAFGDEADFSGITGARDLSISAVVHKAFIQVDEKGTEAAAIAGAIMSADNIDEEPPPPVVFRADHPFLYLIRDGETGAILFIGRCSQP